MTRPNVLGRLPRPTRNACREAIQSIVLNVKAEHRLKNRDLADRLGCSEGTIENAENAATTLSAETIAAFEHEFGTGTIDPWLALAGSRALAINPHAVCDAMTAPLELAEALHKLIEMQHPDSAGGVLITDDELRIILPFLRDARGVLDALISRVGG